MNRGSDSQAYRDKKAFFDKVLTIYGRNPVMEMLEDESITLHKLHLSRSNSSAPVLDKMTSIAKTRAIEVIYHEKKSLSRISKNAKQDQGVALDIIMPNTQTPNEFISNSTSYRIIALDGITNPQNTGMIIRSCAAGNIDAVIIPGKGGAKLSPLTIKASSGTLFKIPIISTNDLAETLALFQKHGADLCRLSSHTSLSYRDQEFSTKTIFVLGNESTGVSREIEAMCDGAVAIPMQRGVESLNVAVTAALLAFY